MTPALAARVVVLGLVVAACGGGVSPASTSTSEPTSPPVPTPTATADPTGGTTPPPSDGPTPVPDRSWTQLTPRGAAPAAREDHTWTVNEEGEAAFLFGGRDGSTVHGDLWGYELGRDAWHRVDTGSAGPAARFGHEAAWLPGHGLLVFGGQAGSTFFNDLWLYDPVAGSWTELQADGDVPVARYGSCSAVGANGLFRISHGFTAEGARFDDTKVFDIDQGRWFDETPDDELPVRRCLHVCWWTSDGRFALLGGQTNGDPALGDLWILTPQGGEARSGWQAEGTPLASDRNMVAAVVAGEEVVLFGGRDGDGRALAELYVGGSSSRGGFAAVVPDGVEPGARWGATLVHDAARARVLLYGGTDGAANAEVWSLSGF